MPFFLAHYLPLVDRITFIDNGSTDKTIPLIKAAAKPGGPEIRLIESGMKTWDWDLGLVYRNTVWKDSDFDYVMWADLDEIIYHPDLRNFLEKTNADIYQTKGYDMVSGDFPKPGTNILDIKMGSPTWLEDKYLIWKPQSGIESTSAHTIAETKKVVNRGEILLLHYKYLGVQIMVRRARLIKSRVPPNSFCRGIGGNILKKYPGFVKSEREYVKEISDRLKSAVKVI